MRFTTKLLLAASFTSVLALASCTPQPDYERLADLHARTTCDQLKTQSKKLSPWVQCYNDEIMSFYAANSLQLPEEKYMLLMKSKVLSPKVDAGQMSEAEFNFEISDYQRQMRIQKEQLDLQRKQIEMHEEDQRYRENRDFERCQEQAKERGKSSKYCYLL